MPGLIHSCLKYRLFITASKVPAEEYGLELHRQPAGGGQDTYNIYIYYDYIYIYIIADIIPIPNAKCGAFLGAIWMGTSPAGPATDSGLHDDLRWQNEQQHDYGPAWKPTGRDLPQETKQLHLFNGKSGDQKIVCFRDFQ